MTLAAKFYLFFTSLHFFSTPHPQRIATVTIPEDEIVIMCFTEENINY